MQLLRIGISENVTTMYVRGCVSAVYVHNSSEVNCSCESDASHLATGSETEPKL